TPARAPTARTRWASGASARGATARPQTGSASRRSSGERTCSTAGRRASSASGANSRRASATSRPAAGRRPGRAGCRRQARLGACPETAVHGSGGTVSASIRRRWTRVREQPTRAAPHRRSDGAPAPVLRRHGPGSPRGRPAGEAAATPHARSRRRFKAAQAGSPSSRTFVTPRNMKRRKPIACLLSSCRRRTCGTRAGPNGTAGRRGRRRSAYEAPRAAADGDTRLGGAESKRRRRPRLPAPLSRVTLLDEAPHLRERVPVRVGVPVVLHGARDVLAHLAAVGAGDHVERHVDAGRDAGGGDELPV